jgi:hypothetical protein
LYGSNLSRKKQQTSSPKRCKEILLVQRCGQKEESILEFRLA